MIKWRKTVSGLLTLALAASLSFVAPAKTDAAYGERITVSGTQFMAGGQRIWMNGANTPWNAWDDFGGSFDATWWSNHFQTLRDNGINSTRIWITCDGEVGINIAADGTVSGATAAHWSDLDTLFQLAQSKGIYIMATLISFDHFKDYHPNYMKWRNMISSSAKVDSFVNNYIIPFVNRYKSNPYLWSIDLCNEPDWIYEDASAGQLSWDVLQTYFAKAAVAVHQNSSILVTVGMAMAKYNSDTVSGAQGNKISNAALQAKVNSTAAKVDFYSPHYYDWMGQYWGVPFYGSPAAFGLETSKPAMIGETPANGTTGHTLTQDYENAYVNGWQGVQAWTSNGVDSQGNLSTLGPAANAFRNNHGSLVFPTAGGIPTNGLQMWLKFDETSGTTAADSSGNGRSGTATGGASWSTDGKYGGSVNLDGTNDWVNIPDMSFSGDFTVGAWVKLSGTIDNKDAIVGQEGAGQDLNFYGAKLRLYAGSDVIVANTALSANTWRHFVVTRSGSSLKLYVDGVQDATGTWTGTFAPKAVGRGNGGYTLGKIDDFVLYNRALSQTEINQLRTH